MKENWVLKNKKADLKAISDSFGVSPVLAKILANKGYEDIDEIGRFLHPSPADLNPPRLLKDMSRAVMLIKKAIDNGEQICIVGDYDVDGVTSTFLLMSAFEKLGAYVTYRIPDRITDGYGISMGIIDDAIDMGCDLIVTCDNGISAVDQIAYAKEKGLSVVITDHHDVPETLPPADAIVNPKQKDCEYPQKEICGAVVAAKLCEVLFEEYGFGPFIEKHMDILALATVCDVMKLVGENRYIVKKGLECLAHTENTGLEALIETTGMQDKKITAYSLGFVLGPCLNATGRLESAVAGVELLRSTQKSEALVLAAKLKDLNELRKDMTLKAVEKAREKVLESDLSKDSILCVYIPGCHESLAGIVAGRVREEFNRPSLVFTDSSVSEEVLKASGRSTEDYNMYEGLTEVSDLILKFGGHPMAAGLSIARENLELLRQKLNENCKEDLVNKPKKIMIDISKPPTTFSLELLDELSLLEPFGNGNEKPVFAERNVEITRLSRFGKEGNYIKAEALDSLGSSFTLTMFSESDSFLEGFEQSFGKQKLSDVFRGRAEGCKINVIYNPEINEYRGSRSIQYMLKNVAFPENDKKDEASDKNDIVKTQRAYIFGSASGIPKRLDCKAEDYIYFCDGGLKYFDHVKQGKCTLLGDFDSLKDSEYLDEKTLEGLTDGSVREINGREMKIRRFPVDKDASDVELAIRLAIKDGCDEIILCGCAGGERPDHQFGNLALLKYISKQKTVSGGKITAVLFDGNYSYVVLSGEKQERGKSASLTIKDSAGKRFSAFALGEKAEGLSLTGFLYELRNAELLPDITLGASNMIKENSAHITLDKGTVLLIIEAEPDLIG
ncbi:MAG: single-stranded-DNA-specific exonuclease RecJ [Lachnospiraceae bacterium]|nr:single-stranded-DNA-specific exonuclease RecJ [Lachnospiraceae bacterium]